MSGKRRADGLTEMMVSFCRWYVKTHNGSLSARKAGYSVNCSAEIARELLADPRIKQYIRLLKGPINEELHVEAVDVLRKYVQIGMADLSSFVTQETEYVPDIGPNGLQKMDQGFPMFKPVLVTRMRPLDEIDGGLIKRIKATKSGVEIELEPKDRALEKLAKHFDLFEENARLKIEKERLELEKRKLEIMESTAKGIVDPAVLAAHNAQILTLAELFRSPEKDRTIEELESDNV